MYPISHSTSIVRVGFNITIRECGLEVTAPYHLGYVGAMNYIRVASSPDWTNTYLARLPPELSNQLFSPRVYRKDNSVIATTPGIYIEYFDLKREVFSYLSNGQALIGQGALILRIPRDKPWAKLLLAFRKY